MNRRLLLADDDDAIRETIADLLEIEGWAIVEARNGVEALERAGAEPFDVVILDERMPGLRGSDVYRALREKGVHVPVVLITAANGIDRLAASLGVPAFLAKPFKVDDLLDALDRVIPREE